MFERVGMFTVEINKEKVMIIMAILLNFYFNENIFCNEFVNFKQPFMFFCQNDMFVRIVIVTSHRSTCVGTVPGPDIAVLAASYYITYYSNTYIIAKF